MVWLLLATAGEFLNAVVEITDKYIVTDEKVLPRPFVYAFYSCLVTGFWLLIYVFDFIPGLHGIGLPSVTHVHAPSLDVVALSLLAAYTFFMALVSMYDGLKHADASDVMPVIGAVSAMSSFAMSYFFLHTVLRGHYLWGLLLLSLGTFLVSRMRFTRTVALHAIHSGIFFALYYITMKDLFTQTSFDNGFFWSRLMFMLYALSLLLVPAYYEKIMTQTKQTTKKGGTLVLGNKILAGVAAFMLLKATDLGIVSVVQSMDGLKYVFIVIISVVLGRLIPTSAGENEYSAGTLLRKALYISIISFGLVILFT